MCSLADDWLGSAESSHYAPSPSRTPDCSALKRQASLLPDAFDLMSMTPEQTQSLTRIVVCPACEGALDLGQDAWGCASCNRQYAVRYGILDLRVDYAPSAEELAYADELHEMSTRRTFEDLIRHHFGQPGLPEDLHDLFERNELANAVRGRDRLFKIRVAMRSAGRTPSGSGLALDVGCGTGSGVDGLARGFDQVVGLDYAFCDLLLARRFLEERGHRNAHFVCGSAMQLPFRSGVFDLVNATDVVEHLPDQEESIRQMHRVLRCAGHLYFNSPNRFSLFSPEPHVGLWLVGFLPRRWMASYVGFRRGRPYKHIRLMSVREVRRAAQAVFETNARVHGYLPDSWPRCTSPVRRMLRRRRIMRCALNTFFWPVLPQYHVLAWRGHGAASGAAGEDP